jgi:uncharacterized membrane protein
LLLMALTIFGRTQGSFLLIDGAVVWLLVWLHFAFWYWQLDRGGPSQRERSQSAPWEIVFPAQANHYPGHERWRPLLTDYVLLALTISLTFSPGDSTVVTRRLKWLLMGHMLMAASALILVAGRALNIAS